MFKPVDNGRAQLEWLPKKQKRKGEKAVRTCEISSETYELILQYGSDQ